MERKRVEGKPLPAVPIENCDLSLPSVQFHPRSLDFSGGTAHTAENAQKLTIPRRLDSVTPMRAMPPKNQKCGTAASREWSGPVRDQVAPQSF